MATSTRGATNGHNRHCAAEAPPTRRVPHCPAPPPLRSRVPTSQSPPVTAGVRPSGHAHFLAPKSKSRSRPAVILLSRPALPPPASSPLPSNHLSRTRQAASPLEPARRRLYGQRRPFLLRDARACSVAPAALEVGRRLAEAVEGLLREPGGLFLQPWGWAPAPRWPTGAPKATTCTG